jgi:hypothetical protein
MSIYSFPDPIECDPGGYSHQSQSEIQHTQHDEHKPSNLQAVNSDDMDHRYNELQLASQKEGSFKQRGFDQFNPPTHPVPNPPGTNSLRFPTRLYAPPEGYYDCDQFYLVRNAGAGNKFANCFDAVAPR